jgi:transcriptional regulator with XRE-family HTH domain
MSLRRVAQEVGVSASLISQVETGRAQPSVATLYALASLLSISIDDLLGLSAGGSQLAARYAPDLHIQRHSDNPVIEMENGVRWERLAMGARGPADALLATYQPGASSSLEGRLMRHPGVEYAYILEGVLTLQFELDTYELRRGDSLHFDSSRPHMFANRGSVSATGVWVVVGRQNSGVSPRARNRAPRDSSVRSAVEVLQRLDSLEPGES